VLCFCFVLLRLITLLLQVSLDCSFLIAPSVFSNVYLISILHVLLAGSNMFLFLDTPVSSHVVGFVLLDL